MKEACEGDLDVAGDGDAHGVADVQRRVPRRRLDGALLRVDDARQQILVVAHGPVRLPAHESELVSWVRWLSSLIVSSFMVSYFTQSYNQFLSLYWISLGS